MNRLSLCLAIFLISLVSISFAQTKASRELGREIQIRRGYGGSTKSVRCYPTNKLIVTKQEFRELVKAEKCSPLKSLSVDFSKHTLINYRVGGDCFMRVTHKVFRDEKTKTYTVEVKNYWGRCRAGGAYHSWFVIDKLPEGYKVELKEIQIDDVRKPEPYRPPSIEYIETEPVDLNGCIPMYDQNQFVIRDNQTYLELTRKDAQAKECIKNSKDLDFAKYTYIGKLIRSGYCRYPAGLEHQLIKDNTKKEYVLDISYTDPEGQVCRASSRYDLWLQVPKLEKGFEVTFKVTPKPRNKTRSLN